MSSNIFAGIGDKIRHLIGALHHRPGRRPDRGLYYPIRALVDATFIARLRKIYYELKFALLGFRTGLQRHPRSLIGLSVTICAIRRTFHVRYRSRGDLGVYYQIFVNRDYDLTPFPQARQLGSFYDALVKENKRPLIIDAGSNIGASIVWFAARYPLSKIAAIEPNKNNCQLLIRNCAGIDYQLFAGGIGSVDGVMYLEDPGFSDWGFRVAEAGAEEGRIFSAKKLVHSLGRVCKSSM